MALQRYAQAVSYSNPPNEPLHHPHLSVIKNKLDAAHSDLLVL